MSNKKTNKALTPEQLKLIPNAKEKPKQKKHIVKAINIKQLKQRKYAFVDLGEYTHLLGPIDGKCLITCYGPPGSGKSTWALFLANYLADKYGKTLYDSHEEQFNRSIQERVNQMENPSAKIFFTPGLSHAERMERIKRLKYRVVVIDSVQYAKLSYDQLIEMRETFKKRNIIFILISFGSHLGKIDGDNKILYASDIKMFFSGGRLTSISRYNGHPVYKVLFNPNASQQLQLSKEQATEGHTA